MPSPLAHGSLLLLAWPPASRARGAPHARLPRALLALSILGALWAPDGDILLDPLLGNAPFTLHGGPVHSLLLGLLFGVVFAAWCKLFTSLSWMRLWLIGTAAWWSHVLMDAATHGRGVMLLWPFSADRLRLPTPLFVGLHHSDWSRWDLHLLTLANELVFAALICGAAALLRRFPSRHPTHIKPAAAPAEGTP